MNCVSRIRIVHPRTPETDRIAMRLSRELCRYRVPRDIQRRTGIHDTKGIADPWLIVICTPETPADPEIRKAVTSFTEQGAAHRILTLLVSGKPEESFPEELTRETLADGSVVDREPLAANISAPSESARNRKIRVEKLRLLAPMLGVSFDDLRNRRRVQRMRILIPACTVAALAALFFLGYALNRVRILSEQNRKLDAQLAARLEALSEAESQRDAAEADYIRQIAEKARNQLSQQHTETALLLCMEMLPEHADSEELRDVFRDALETACAAGYSPMDETKNRRSAVAVKTGTLTPERDARFPYRKNFPVPEEFGSSTVVVKSEPRKNGAQSADLKCGYYWCNVESEDGGSVHYMMFHFPDEPEKDFVFRNADGNPVRILGSNDGAFLPDNTFVAWLYPDEVLCRVDLSTGEAIPLLDEPEEAGADQPEPEAFTDVEKIIYEPGMKCVLMLAKPDTVYVFSASPFRYIRTVEGIKNLKRKNGSNVMYVRNGPLSVYSLDSFELLYTVTPGEDEKYSMEDMLETEPGKGFLLMNRRVYDLYSGRLLTNLDETFGGRIEQISAFSADGCLLLTVGNETLVWDQNTQTVKGTVPSPDATFSGVRDEAKSKADSRIVQASGILDDGIFWIYRETACAVPDDLEEQMTIAREYLEDAAFSTTERIRFNLD